jgi:hypothetical protein
MYFALQGLLAVLREVYEIDNLLWLAVLFPVAKILGDLLALAMQLRRGYFFLEDWFRESLWFVLFYGLLTALSAEFWRNFLGVGAYPDMTFMAVVCYALLDYEREKKSARVGRR